MAEDDRRCERLGDYADGTSVWKLTGEGGRVFILPPGIIPTFDKSQLPTRKVVQWHYVHQSGEVYGTDTPNKGRRVEWELCGDKILGVRLVEGDDE